MPIFKTENTAGPRGVALKIAIIGLTPADTLIIKSHFAKFAPDTEIEWLGLDSVEADGLIFRARYLNTPTVEAWIQRAPKDAAVAAAYRDPATCAACGAAGVYLLDLAHHDPETLQAWMGRILRKESNAAAVQQAIAVTSAKYAGMAEPAVGAAGAPMFDVTGVELPPYKARPIAPPSDRDEDSLPLAEPDFPNAAVLRAIIRDGADMLAACDECRACFRPALNRVWADQPLDRIPPFENCRWQAHEGETPPELRVAADMRQWLWESLWKSNLDLARYVRDDASFRLLVWPQPHSAADRGVPLRIAAMLQRGPAGVATLAELTRIPPERVKKLLCTMQLVGFAEELRLARHGEEIAGYETPSAANANRLNVLRKLRDKLNLHSA